MSTDQMAGAMRGMASHRAESMQVDRRGWTRAQWVADAKRLMNEPDGSVMSLMNGHAISFLVELERITAERDQAHAAIRAHKIAMTGGRAQGDLWRDCANCEERDGQLWAVLDDDD